MTYPPGKAAVTGRLPCTEPTRGNADKRFKSAPMPPQNTDSMN